MKRVSIFPSFDAFNQSFFLYCLGTVFGAHNIRFTTNGFPNFTNTGMLKVILHGDQQTRIFIDHWDLPVFDDEGLQWCDIYAKRNIDPNAVPSKHANKIVPSGPSFPVRWCDALDTAVYSMRTLWTCFNARDSGRLNLARTKEHFANWYRQCAHRRPIEEYQPGECSLNDYIFFTCSLWKRDNAANDVRAMFIRACKSIPSIIFEGGFKRRSDIDAHRDLMVDAWYMQRQFIEKTKRSAVVFNNPAVARCHSWRLGEALAMGKAIISLPIERMMPAPLIHGRNVHYVDPTIESIRDAIELICRDTQYRARLENGAREYYVEHLSPAAVIERVAGLGIRNLLVAKHRLSQPDSLDPGPATPGARV